MIDVVIYAGALEQPIADLALEQVPARHEFIRVDEVTYQVQTVTWHLPQRRGDHVYARLYVYRVAPTPPRSQR